MQRGGRSWRQLTAALASRLLLAGINAARAAEGISHLLRPAVGRGVASQLETQTVGPIRSILAQLPVDALALGPDLAAAVRSLRLSEPHRAYRTGHEFVMPPLLDTVGTHDVATSSAVGGDPFAHLRHQTTEYAVTKALATRRNRGIQHSRDIFDDSVARLAGASTQRTNSGLRVGESDDAAIVDIGTWDVRPELGVGNEFNSSTGGLTARDAAVFRRRLMQQVAGSTLNRHRPAMPKPTKPPQPLRRHWQGTKHVTPPIGAFRDYTADVDDPNSYGPAMEVRAKVRVHDRSACSWPCIVPCFTGAVCMTAGSQDGTH